MGNPCEGETAKGEVLSQEGRGSPHWDLTDKQFSSKRISVSFDIWPRTSCSSHFQQRMYSI